MKKFFALLLALTLACSLMACSSDTPAPTQQDTSPSSDQGDADTQTPSPSASPKSGSLTIGLSTNALSNIHGQAIYETTIANGEARGHKVIATNANGGASQQATDIENLIEQGCDVIIIQNGEADALINVVARAKERGIYVISYESGWIDGCDSMFGVNDFACGSDLYMKIAAEMGFEGEIITLHHNDHPVPRSHYLVIEAMLKEYTNIVSVNDGYTGYPATTELAYKIVESALTANPNVKAIWATFDLEAIGAMQACQAMGRDDIMIIGYDGEADVLKTIQEGGQIIATCITGYKEACENVITVAEQLAAGEPVNAHYDIEYIIIDSTNIDEYADYYADAE